METYTQYQAAQFRVALLLKQYKFGAVSAAKYLGKSRSIIQSWMQIGNKHHLSKEKIMLKSFEKILKKLRRRLTKEHLDYFMVKRFLALELPVAFIAKILELPTSTVRSWRYGRVPVEIKRFFYDRRLIDYEFNKLLKSLKKEITTRNLEYYISLYLAKSIMVTNGRRQIGGRMISQILTTHFGYIQPIPEKTISCWIDGKRKPWDAFPVLMDEQLVQREANKIVDKLTYQYLFYHISIKLAEDYDWKYSKINSVLNLNKELVRGWVKKGRGNPVAKTFVNESIVKKEIGKYLAEEDNLKVEEQFNGAKIRQVKQIVFESRLEDTIKNKTENELNKKNVKNDLNTELERELIYHLETIPTGVSSPLVLKSILIDYRESSLEEIEITLQKSEHIIQNKNNGKWMLKRFVDKENIYDELILKEDLAKINCKKGQNDEIIC